MSMRLLQHRRKSGCTAGPYQAGDAFAALSARHRLFHKPATQHEDTVAALPLKVKLLALAKPYLPAGHGCITDTSDLSPA
jgi:hypothetical protein